MGCRYNRRHNSKGEDRQIKIHAHSSDVTCRSIRTCHNDSWGGRRMKTERQMSATGLLREHVPFLAPWKKKRTTKTCKPAIDTIIKPSITLKLKIRRSVLRAVLKLRFSRVRKYFWLREMVDSWADSLKMDSSRAEACSGVAPCREGSCARSSFSIWWQGAKNRQHQVLARTGFCSHVIRAVQHTAISKSTSFSANVDISLLKQNRYSPTL